MYNKNYNSIRNDEEITERDKNEIQINPQMEYTYEIEKVRGIDANENENEVEKKHDFNCNYITNYNRKTTNVSKNSSNAQTSTTASYSYDEKDSTTNTKLNEIYKSNPSDNSINLFPFQVETVI